MKILMLVPALGVFCVGLATDLSAQTLPQVINVRLEAPGMLRGTLTNPLSVALSAWTIDVVDKGGKPRLTQISDALLVPAQFLGPKQSIDLRLSTNGAEGIALVFRSAITANGMEVGDLGGAFNIIDRRFKRAVALEAMLDLLRSLDPTTLADTVYKALLPLAPEADDTLLHDLSRSARSGPAMAWITTAEELRQKNRAGAMRHAILRDRLSGHE